MNVDKAYTSVIWILYFCPGGTSAWATKSGDIAFNQATVAPPRMAAAIDEPLYISVRYLTKRLGVAMDQATYAPDSNTAELAQALEKYLRAAGFSRIELVAADRHRGYRLDIGLDTMAALSEKSRKKGFGTLGLAPLLGAKLRVNFEVIARFNFAYGGRALGTGREMINGFAISTLYQEQTNARRQAADRLAQVVAARVGELTQRHLQAGTMPSGCLPCPAVPAQSPGRVLRVPRRAVAVELDASTRLEPRVIDVRDGYHACPLCEGGMRPVRGS